MASFYEFFAGGGMARAGLGLDWQCLFANDFDSKKAASYAANWGNDHLQIEDVAALTTADLPGEADLAWASFPCQDLSLAGAGAGLHGKRSGTFWPFWKLIKTLGEEGRAPRLVVLENVCGALSSHGGEDFATIGAALSSSGYRFGAAVLNAVHFLPQSRPRLFIVGVHKSSPISHVLTAGGPQEPWHPRALVTAYGKLSKDSQRSWVWWRLPEPPARPSVLADLVEDEPCSITWNGAAETEKLLSMMNPNNLIKVEAAKRTMRRVVGAIYKRTRANGSDGQKVQRAEIRLDNVAGCLRTPAGGSSRQTIMIIERERIRSRLLSPREAARLMGLSDTYTLPQNYNDAYHLAGDGVAVPVVRFLAEHLLEPLLTSALALERRAA
ncbi:MAG: DNA cytosine methyltransferase [Burkholderiaceae bacterium]|jgi:DNA (cytosine-5)-methyltransferase 1|nr:DNA cytosine methyltransferase [Burkholderiaceae bacterium]